MPKPSVRSASLLALTLAFCLGAKSHSQTLPPPPGEEPAGKTAMIASGPSAFDVASVHEHSGGDGSMRWMTNPDGVTMVNIPLQSLISMAYNVKMYLISGGPSWVDSKGFDVDAKVLPGDAGGQVKLTEEQRRTMMRNLLLDRFHLGAHVESRTLPVYDLVVAKGGSKMQAAPPSPPSADAKTEETKNRTSMYFEPGHLKATAYKIPALAEQLGYTVQRTVLDRTGLTGEYDFSLSWTPEEQLQEAGDKATTGADSKPSIYAAIQEQLGLKLVPTKGPVDTLVIDHVELPTAN